MQSTIKHNLNLIHTKYPEHILNQNIHLFNNIDWQSISMWQSLSEPFIEKYHHKLYWYDISAFQSLSEPFIEKYQDKVSWTFISKFQSLSFSFIKKYQHKLDWDLLPFNYNIPIITKLLSASRFNWYDICYL